MKTTSLALTGLFAALLATPPATAAQKTGKTPDKSPLIALLKNGLADLNQRDFDSAIKKFTKATKLSNDCRPLYLLGLAHYEKGARDGDPETADKREARETLSAYSKAMDRDPGRKAITDPSRFYRSLAWSYEVLQSYDRAAAAYRSAMSADPANPMLPLYAARIYGRMGVPAKAAKSLAESLQRAQKLGQEDLIRATVRKNPRYSSMLSYPDISAVIGVVATAAKDSVAQNAPAAGQEELRDALNDRGPALARELPAVVQPAPAVMDALAAGDENFKFRQYRTAINAYSAAVKLDAKTLAMSPVQRALLYERMGTSYNRLGLSQEAIATLQRSVQAMPNDAASHYQLALAYSTSGRFREALAALDETFKSAASPRDLRKYLILSKSDSELDPVRDMPDFESLVNHYAR